MPRIKTEHLFDFKAHAHFPEAPTFPGSSSKSPHIAGKRNWSPQKGVKRNHSFFPTFKWHQNPPLLPFLIQCLLFFLIIKVLYDHCRTLGKYRKEWRELKLPTVLPPKGNPSYHTGAFPSRHIDVDLSRVSRVKRAYTNLASHHISILCLLSFFNIIFSYISVIVHKHAFNSRIHYIYFIIFVLVIKK